MERVDLVRTLVGKIRNVSNAYTKYITSPREYFNGERLFMREAHFVIAVGKGSEPTMSELAQTLEVTRGAISQLAQRMEQKGYVERVSALMDKRKNHVRLTDKGAQLYLEHEEYDAHKYKEISDVLSLFSQEQLELFIKFEQDVYNIFEK